MILHCFYYDIYEHPRQVMWHNRDERKIHLSAYIEDQLAMKELHHKTVLSLLLHSGVVYATKVLFF